MSEYILTVQGFALTPDEAIADFYRRAVTHMADGWMRPSEVIVQLGPNPYSELPVHGYIATGRLTK